MLEQHRVLLVDARAAERSAREDPARGAQDHRRHRHEVHAGIEQHAPAELPVEQIVPRFVRWHEGAAADQHAHAAQAAVREVRSQRDHGGQETSPHRFHGKQTVGPGGSDHALGFRCVQREGLFAQHGLAALETGQHVVSMPDVGRCNVDGIDVGGRELVHAVERGGMPCRSAKSAFVAVARRPRRVRYRGGPVLQARRPSSTPSGRFRRFPTHALHRGILATASQFAPPAAGPISYRHVANKKRWLQHGALWSILREPAGAATTVHGADLCPINSWETQ